MVRRQQRFTVRQPLEMVYRFLSDPAQVGSCLAFGRYREWEREPALAGESTHVGDHRYARVHPRFPYQAIG
jgi:hypothetical protein